MESAFRCTGKQTVLTPVVSRVVTEDIPLIQATQKRLRDLVMLCMTVSLITEFSDSMPGENHLMGDKPNS
jgi:hypothetical protein